MDERVGAIRALVEAAARVAARRELVPAFARAARLSPAGVEHALAWCLERDPPAAEVEALAAGAPRAEAVAVVLSANVFTAPLRAIALARAAAPRVVVRPSSRDPLFAAALVAELGDPAITLAPHLDLAAIGAGEIHVYGRDATVEALRASARVPVRGHAAGMGIALVGGPPPHERLAGAFAASARALALDVIAFDQRGCLSPRVALVLGDRAGAERFAEHLDAALVALAADVPRGELDDDERASARRWTDALAFAGTVRATPSHAVAVVPDAAALALPPTGRHVLVAPVADAAAARAALAPFARWITMVGADAPALAAEVAPRHARRAALGAMQRPPFDGPVDLRDQLSREPDASLVAP